MDEKNWSFTISIEVKGPNEGEQTLLLRQKDTTKSHALNVQKALTLLCSKVNSGELTVDQLLEVVK